MPASGLPARWKNQRTEFRIRTNKNREAFCSAVFFAPFCSGTHRSEKSGALSFLRMSERFCRLSSRLVLCRQFRSGSRFCLFLLLSFKTPRRAGARVTQYIGFLSRLLSAKKELGTARSRRNAFIFLFFKIPVDIFSSAWYSGGINLYIPVKHFKKLRGSRYRFCQEG